MDPVEIYKKCTNFFNLVDKKDSDLKKYYDNNYYRKFNLLNYLIQEFNFDTKVVEKFLDLHKEIYQDIICECEIIHKINFGNFLNGVKILFLIEYYKELYGTVRKTVLKFIFSYLLNKNRKYLDSSRFHFYNLFEELFFKIEFYEEKYINFIKYDLYDILYNISNEYDMFFSSYIRYTQLNTKYRESFKKISKYYNMMEMGPNIYFLELLCENKIEKANLLYPIVRQIVCENDTEKKDNFNNNFYTYFDNSPENDLKVYKQLILLLSSNRLTNFDIVNIIVSFFKNNFNINKTKIQNMLLKEKEKIINNDKLFFELSENKYGYYDPLNKSYGILNINSDKIFFINHIIYNYFCLLEGLYQNMIFNKELLFDGLFLKNILVFKKDLLDNNNTFENYYSQYFDEKGELKKYLYYF